MAKFGIWSMLGDPTALGALAQARPDFIGIDAQHGVVGPRDLQTGLAILGAYGIPSFVRVMSSGDPLLAHAVDFGATALVVPMVARPEELGEAISRTRLQPRGIRSVVAERFSRAAGAEEGSDRASVFAMLETRAAVERLQDLAAVDGLAGFLLGPADLALAFDEEPGSAEARALVEDVGKKVLGLRAESSWGAGIFVSGGASAAAAATRGYDYVVVGSDLGWLEEKAARDIEDARVGSA